MYRIFPIDGGKKTGTFVSITEKSFRVAGHFPALAALFLKKSYFHPVFPAMDTDCSSEAAN